MKKNNMNDPNHIYFVRDPDHQPSSFSNLNSKNLCLTENIYRLNFLQYLPRLFTLTTKNGSALFNIELLIDTSSVISNFLKHNPQVFQYNLDIEDKDNILGKFEKLYQGYKVVFEEDELPVSKKITRILNIKCCPNYMKPESLQGEEPSSERGLGLQSGVAVSKNYLNQFIRRDNFQTFTIVSGGEEFKCNYFGVLASQVIRELILKEPTLLRYDYDADDEYSDFQLIVKLFNLGIIPITTNNVYFLKNAAEQLKIDVILPKIEQSIEEFDKVSKTIDEQQVTLEIIENLFELLYNVNNSNIESVKNKIIESNWSKTEEDIQELAAFIIQVVKSDFNQHPYLIELLTLLDKEANESNKLSILKPYITKQLMFLLGNSLPISSFIYNLYKQEFISKDYLLDQLKACFDHWTKKNKMELNEFNGNVYVWFMPELIELNLFDDKFWNNESQECSSSVSNFINYYYPSKIDLYKKMRDNGQPDDELTASIRVDDVDKAQKILTMSGSDISKIIIPYNIFELFNRNGQTKLIDYAASYGSVKCFKYLILNYCEVDDFTFNCAVYGGNNEIIKIVDQRIQSSSSSSAKQPELKQPLNFNSIKYTGTSRPYVNVLRNDIYPAIMKHQNKLFDWIIEHRYISDIDSNSNRFLSYSAENGNAYSFIETMDKCPNSNSFIDLIQAASRNGLYKLANIIYDIMKKKKSK